MDLNLYFSRLKPDKVNSLVGAIELLDQWILKILEDGLRSLEQDDSRLQEISTRLSDLGAGALSKRIRLFKQYIATENWHEKIVHELATLSILTHLIQSKSSLSLYDPEDILAYIGFSHKKADVMALNIRQQDQWKLIGQLNEKEEQLRLRRSWFYGNSTQSIALVLEYQVNAFSPYQVYKFNRDYHDQVYFYPGAVKQRIVQLSTDKSSPPASWNITVKSLEESIEDFQKALLANPFLQNFVQIITGCRIIKLRDQFYLQDQNGLLLAIANNIEQLNKIYPYTLSKDCIFFLERGQNLQNKILSLLLGELHIFV